MEISKEWLEHEREEKTIKKLKELSISDLRLVYEICTQHSREEADTEGKGQWYKRSQLAIRIIKEKVDELFIHN